MHELSICRAIAGSVEDHAGGRPVSSVRLRIGHFRQVIPETLAYCWDLHVRDTPLMGAALDVDYIPAVVRCPACETNTTLDLPVLRCGVCQSSAVELLSGEEFLIESIEVSTAVREEQGS
jgi:hydrogenase nickel incorporation protein HypA/HybF